MFLSVSFSAFPPTSPIHITIYLLCFFMESVYTVVYLYSYPAYGAQDICLTNLTIQDTLVVFHF